MLQNKRIFIIFWHIIDIFLLFIKWISFCLEQKTQILKLISMSFCDLKATCASTWGIENIFRNTSPEWSPYTSRYSWGVTWKAQDLRTRKNFGQRFTWVHYIYLWLNWRNTWGRYTLQFLTELEEYLRPILKSWDWTGGILEGLYLNF